VPFTQSRDGPRINLIGLTSMPPNKWTVSSTRELNDLIQIPGWVSSGAFGQADSEIAMAEVEKTAPA
jgi:hypothetical protein